MASALAGVRGHGAAAPPAAPSLPASSLPASAPPKNGFCAAAANGDAGGDRSAEERRARVPAPGVARARARQPLGDGGAAGASQQETRSPAGEGGDGAGRQVND